MRADTASGAGPAIDNVVIVGAGQAGLQVAAALRKRRFSGAITLIGDETHPPYQRPPLSKAYFKGELAADRLFLKPLAFYEDQDVALVTGDAVDAVDLDGRTVRTRSGRTIAFDGLVFATGSTPRRLPGAPTHADGLFVLRGLDDADAMRAAIRPGARVVVIGGGYIGLEAASAAKQLGCAVTVLERAPRLLARVTSAPVADFYARLHADRGVDVRCDARVAGVDVQDGRVVGVRMDDGETIAADAVLVGIGVTPNDETARAAGVACDDGVLVDDDGRTAHPRIYAAGDCARRPWKDGTVRLESVHNALDQGERIAADIVGAAPPPPDPPWFWSDQYEVKLQTAGLFNDFDEIALRGAPENGRFAAFYFKDGAFIAVDAVNDPASFLCGKQILKLGGTLSPDDASDENIDLKTLIRR
ncbi:MAG: FAD-dependent oxidoreductase [Pseudomonadota bacterium]